MQTREGGPVIAGADTLAAVRNALTLGGSLLFTWGISIGIRILMPRELGPERFGTLSFVDAFTATFFVALGLGADVYVRKEVAVRAEHASDFFGGMFVVRLVMTAGIFGAMTAVLHRTHRPADVYGLVWIFAFAQFFVTNNETLSAMLQAKGRVAGMSVLSVVSKIVWAGGVLVAIATGGHLVGFGAAFLVSEATKSVALYVLAARHLDLVFRVDAAATRAMVRASLPYYANAVAITAYGKLDVTVLTLVGTGREVGWYSGASTIAGITLLATPLIGWVLMPMFARAAARSRDELYALIAGATEIILVVVIPVSLFIVVGADVWVRLLFGVDYAPAALALRILGAMFALMYVAMVYAITLMMLERAWTVAIISFGGLFVNVALNLLLIPPSLAFFGDGGGGAGCALAMLGTQIVVTTAMACILGTKAVDQRAIGTVAKTLAVCAVVIVVDRLLSPLGWVRLVVDAPIYVVGVVGSGGLRVREMARVLAAAVRSKVPGA